MKLPLPLHSNLWTLLLIFYSTHNGGRYMTTYTSTHINVSTYQKLDRSYFAHSSQYPFCVCMVSHSSPAIAAKLSKLKIWLISLLLAYNSSGSGCLQSREKKKALVFKCLLRPAPTCLFSCLFYLPLVYPHKICCYSMNMAYKVSSF